MAGRHRPKVLVHDRHDPIERLLACVFGLVRHIQLAWALSWRLPHVDAAAGISSKALRLHDALGPFHRSAQNMGIERREGKRVIMVAR
jgi:hypothetical protein